MEVTITNNIIDITSPDKEVSLNGSELVNVHWVTDKFRKTIGALTPAPLADGSASGYVAPTPRYIIVLPMSNKRIVESFYLDEVTNQPGWPNTLVGARQAVTDIKAAMEITGGGGGGLTGITGIAGITYAGTPTSVMTVSDAPDAREALGATISHGPYQAGLVVNFHDLTYENGVVYEWLGSQFTTTGVIATDTNWSVWGAVWQQKNRTLLQLVDTDLVALTGTIDIYYLLDAAGSAEITDTGTFTAGTQFTMRTGPAATQLKFTAVGTIDGAGGSIDVLSGANLQLTSIGSGDWITTA